MPPINLRVYFGPNIVNYRIASTASVRSLVTHLGGHIGVWDISKLRLMHQGGRLYNESLTLEQADVQDGDDLDCMFGMAGGYSADGIYFSSPTEVSQLTLEVSLAPGLAADNIFRPGNGWSHDSSRVIEWNGSITTEPGYGSFSMLQGRDTGSRDHAVAWDLSLDTSGAEVSHVSEHLVLNDANAVVVAFNEFVPYLEDALKSLSLDTNATERFFLSYFRTLIASNYVAIRFLEQATYEQLAPLAISPPPDVVTRVVMLFRNLSEDDIPAWSSARERARLGPTYWKDVIGFDERATDTSLYRALEWRVIESPTSTVDATA